MIFSTAHYPTDHGSRYLQQLCKHFAHKTDVSYDETKGTVALSSGPAELLADAAVLTVRVSAEDIKGIIQARFVIDSHLVTFAHRENFTGLTWAIDPA